MSTRPASRAAELSPAPAAPGLRACSWPLDVLCEGSTRFAPRHLRAALAAWPDPAADPIDAASANTLEVLTWLKQMSGPDRPQTRPGGVRTPEQAVAGQPWAAPLGHPTYPRRLYDLTDPPVVLYGRGDPAELARLNEIPALAVVGTRAISDFGRIVTGVVVEAAAAAGAVVVSGLALGVDTRAHEHALAAGAPTVAVVPVGPDLVYPAANASLAQAILAAGGLVLSEHPLGVDARSGRYGSLVARLQARNRLVVALSDVVVPAEASLASGTCGAVRVAVRLARPLLVALPRTGHREQAGAQLPMRLADPDGRGSLQALRLPAAVVAAHPGGPLAEAARDREQLTDLVREHLCGDAAAAATRTTPVRPTGGGGQ